MVITVFILPILKSTRGDTMAGKYEPTVESLQHYECPRWFRDVKFGIWSCWNAYTVFGVRDWYARTMYIQGHEHYNYRVENYGHSSEFGYEEFSLNV